MKIGILEIMPQGHYTLVDSVARIYASDAQNEIFICTHEEGAEILKPLVNKNIGNIKLIIKDDNESLQSFFEKINNLYLDQLFIITLEKYFDTVYNFQFTCALNLFIHNIDAWFLTGLKYKLYNFFNDFTLSSKIIYKIKVCFIYPKWRKKIAEKILNSNGRFVVLNKFLKIELKKYVSEQRIDVIPFSVYNKDLNDNSLNNTCIRICIPGMVSQVRRDYFSVLNILDEEIDNYKGRIELDLLGGIVESEEGGRIIEHAKKLSANGLKVHYYNNKIVPLAEFDNQLTKADIILGNMKVDVNKYSKYGKTKETGLIYTMIRAAKPGILPSNYELIDEMKSSIMIFEDYSKLKIIFKELVNNKEIIKSLKQNAKLNSLLFDPGCIYKNLSNFN